jgi:hypothetical protein
MDRVVNLELLSHPYNWVIVILMLLIGVWALALLQAPLDQLRTSTMQVI